MYFYLTQIIRYLFRLKINVSGCKNKVFFNFTFCRSVYYKIQNKILITTYKMQLILIDKKNFNLKRKKEFSFSKNEIRNNLREKFVVFFFKYSGQSEKEFVRQFVANENCLSAHVCTQKQATSSSALLHGGTFSFYDIRNVKKEVYGGMCVTGSRSFPYYMLHPEAIIKRREYTRSRTADRRPHENLSLSSPLPLYIYIATLSKKSFT